MMWMFLAILVTFIITRIVTRLIRSGSGARAGLGNVRIAGNHVHHQVFGILVIIGTGIVLVSPAVTASVTRSAGTGCETSSPAPPPRKRQADGASRHAKPCPPPPHTTPGNSARTLVMQGRDRNELTLVSRAERRLRV